MSGAKTASSTSTNTRSNATTATCCFLNLRQNSLQGVRTPALCAAATTSLPGVVVIAGSSVANGGIDEAIKHVNHQVDQDELELEQQHQRLDDGVSTRDYPISQTLVLW